MSKQAPIDPLPHIKVLAASVRLPDQPMATFRALDAAMDAVITVQNTTLYTAGGLGISTFAILPPIPDWRWLGQKKSSPWHDSVRIFHRDSQFDGDELKRIVMRIKKSLAEMHLLTT